MSYFNKSINFAHKMQQGGNIFCTRSIDRPIVNRSSHQILFYKTIAYFLLHPNRISLCFLVYHSILQTKQKAYGKMPRLI